MQQEAIGAAEVVQENEDVLRKNMMANLIQYTPASISVEGLQKMLLYLLEQVAAHREQGKREVESLRREMQTVTEASTSQASLSQVLELREAVVDIEAGVRLCRTGLSDVKGEVASLAEEVAVLSKGQSALKLQVQELEARFNALGDGVKEVAERQESIECKVVMMKNTAPPPQQQQSIQAERELRKQLSELGDLARHNRDALARTNEKADEAILKLEGQVKSIEISIDVLEDAVTKFDRFRERDTTWKTENEEKVGELQRANKKSLESIEGLVVSMKELSNRTNEQCSEIKWTISDLMNRHDNLENRTRSLWQQLALKGAVVDEEDSKSGTALGVLGSKISDILNVLILFESKLHHNEVSIERVEDHLIKALQTATLTSNKGKGVFVPRKKQPKQEVKVEPAAPSPPGKPTDESTVARDTPLLRGRSLFKCLSCNAPQKSDEEAVRVTSKLELDPSLPGAVYRRSPKRHQPSPSHPMALEPAPPKKLMVRATAVQPGFPAVDNAAMDSAISDEDMVTGRVSQTESLKGDTPSLSRLPRRSSSARLRRDRIQTPSPHPWVCQLHSNSNSDCTPTPLLKN